MTQSITPTPAQTNFPTQKNYHATDKQSQEWSFSLPPIHLRSAKMQLLTIGGISVSGVWSGDVGEYFVAWAPLLKVDHAQFALVMEHYRKPHDPIVHECPLCGHPSEE
jgi:hypothetical protein